MGFRFRKSIKIGPARVNLSKSGIGYSVGTKGFRVTKKAGGGTRTTASIPGTGISYTKDSKKRKTSTTSTKKKTTANTSTRSTAPQTGSNQKKIGCLPAVGIFFLIALIIGLLRTYPVITIIALILIAGAAFYVIRKKKAAATALPETAEVTPDATPAEPAPKPESEVRTYRVAGVAHYLDNLMSMMEPNYLYAYKKQELIDACCTNENIYKQTVNTDQLELVPEPTNTHDPNAIMVQLGGKLVGYIPAKDCEHVLKVIRDGRIISLTCKVEGGKYKMVDEDYDCMKDKSTYRMETGEDPYGITVYIREKL